MFCVFVVSMTCFVVFCFDLFCSCGRSVQNWLWGDEQRNCQRVLSVSVSVSVFRGDVIGDAK